MYSAIGVEPTKLTAAMPGWSRMRVDRLLAALHDVEHAVGQPGLRQQLGQRSEAEGSRSDGLRMKQLPQASATGNIHSGTITGKLNGVMPATTPSGWRIDEAVDAGADLLGEVALQQMRDAAGELDHFEAALHLALGVATAPCRARR